MWCKLEWRLIVKTKCHKFLSKLMDQLKVLKQLGDNECYSRNNSCCSLICVWLFATPWTAAFQASLSFTVSLSLLELLSIEVVMPPNHIILCCPLFLLLSVFPASGSFPVNQHFTLKGQSIRASGSASVLPMKIQGWFPLGLTRFDLLSVLGTLKSLLQHYSSKSSILQHTVSMFQLSHPHMIIGKIIALTVCSHFSAKWCLCFLIRCVGFS